MPLPYLPEYSSRPSSIKLDTRLNCFASDLDTFLERCSYDYELTQDLIRDILLRKANTIPESK